MTFLIEICVTITFFALLIYARLFRNFYDLNLLEKNLTEYTNLFQSLFYINLILTFIMLIALYRQYKPKPNAKISVLIGWYFNALNSGLIKIYGFFFNMGIPEYSKYVIDLARVFLYSIWFRISLYCGIIIPRLIIVFCLITEIYLGHIKYFYYSLILLIIPVLIQFIIFMLKDIKPRVFPEFRDHVLIEETKLSKEEEFVANGKNVNVLFTYTMNPKFPKDNFSYFMVNYYEPLLFIENAFNKEFLPRFTKIRCFTLVLYFLILAICWGYIFLFLL